MHSVPVSGAPGFQASRIALGCGRLTAGAGLKRSEAIIKAALEGGITHFDVAPSYGLGSAEDAVGILLGNTAVTITTKVGIPRPKNARLLGTVREIVRPIVGLTPVLKAKLQRATTRSHSEEGIALTREALERSVDESMKRLKRASIDALLLHEPNELHLADDALDKFLSLKKSGDARSLGVGTGQPSITTRHAWDIIQCGWPPSAPTTNASYIRHGILRRLASSLIDIDLEDPENHASAAIGIALKSAADEILIISSNSPTRIAKTLINIPWSFVNSKASEEITLARDLLEMAVNIQYKQAV